MRIDQYGQLIYDVPDIEQLLLQGRSDVLPNVLVEDCKELRQFSEVDTVDLAFYRPSKMTIAEFDATCQEWNIPDQYKQFDVGAYCKSLCNTQAQLDRIEAELNIFRAKQLIPALQALKYLVDTFRAHNVIWGVGRGSAVASYVLFLLGVHKIDSLLYDLDYREFLRSEGD